MMKGKGKKTSIHPSKASTLRIVLKCSWSGSRIEVPNIFTTSSTLFELITSVASQLPPFFYDSSEAQPSLVYIHRTCFKQEWPQKTIASLVGENESGSILFTLNLPGSSATMTTRTLNMDVDEKINTTKTHTKTINSSSSNVSMELDDTDGNTTAEVTIDSSKSSIPTPITRPDHDTNSLFSTTHTDSTWVHNSSRLSVSDETKVLSPNDAVKRLLDQNFDVDSKDCLSTILKIVDNIISKPHDPKVRSLRISNPAIHDRIVSKNGGLEILLSLGFHSEDHFSTDRDRKMVLPPGDAHVPIFFLARDLITQVLVKTLGVSQDDIPPIRLPAREPSSPVANPTFDPYKPFAFNVQSAMAGAPDPTAILPDGSTGLSLTEQKLDQLKKKQMKIEQELFQSCNLNDRNLIAYHSAPTGAIVTVSSNLDTDATFLGSSKGDASLIAGRLKRLEEERKKREEGGFTTSAMRQIDKLMKSKVYSHTQVRVDFPDGDWLSAKFLPHEKISTVKDTIRSVLIAALSDVRFDLYVTPPKRLLNETSTLAEENLVPAAKIRVVWYESFHAVSSCIRPEFFRTDHGATLSYPDAVPIVEDGEKAIVPTENQTLESGSNSQSSKEDELVRRMLGKQSSLLRSRGK